MSVRQKIGDRIKCGQCGETFIFTRRMKQGRRYCKRVCYKEASRQFDTVPYPEVCMPGQKGKRILLHRLIWIEAHPEETLLDTDIIHHIDDNPFNRDPSNLEKITGDARVEHLRRHNFNRKSSSPPVEDYDLDEFGF